MMTLRSRFLLERKTVPCGMKDSLDYFVNIGKAF